MRSALVLIKSPTVVSVSGEVQLSIVPMSVGFKVQLDLTGILIYGQVICDRQF